METLHRLIRPELRILDADKGVLEYVASDPTVDSFKEVVLPAGMRGTNFTKNSPFVDSHDYSTIAKCVGKVLDFRVAGDQLIEKVQWAIGIGNDLADLGWNLTKAGFLKAVSIGFFPVETLTPNSGQPFADALKELNLAADAEVRCIYTKWEQVELSACILGANPNALARARSDGLILDRHLERFPQLASRMEKGRATAFSFPAQSAPSTKSTPSMQSNDNFMKQFQVLTHRSGVPTPKAAFDDLETRRRHGTNAELSHAVTQARRAVSFERRNSGPDPIEEFLEQPGYREYFNALARRQVGKDYPEEFKPLFKDLDVTPAGTGTAFFLPQALSEEIYDLLPLYGAYSKLGVRKLPKMFTKFPQLTGLPSAVFVNASQGNLAVPKDTATVGTQLLPEANVVASLLPVSLQLYEDAGVDLASVLAGFFVRGIAGRVDYACFLGSGVIDAAGLNGGITGIMVDATIKTVVAAQGNITVEQLDRTDFLNVIQTVAPAALQRPCHWFINPGFIPVLLKIAEGNGANWLLKTPSETADGSWSLAGFRVEWTAQMPSVDGPNQKFAAFGEGNAYLVAMSDEIAIGASDSYSWNLLQKVFRAYTRVWGQTRQSTGFATLTTAVN